MTFKYKGLSPSGAPVSGIIDAADEYEAAARIHESCPTLQKIEPVKNGLLQKDISFGGGKIKEKDLAIICSQFAIILKAGLPLVRCLDMIADQTADKATQRLLREVGVDVASGMGLAASFEKRGADKLPVTFIETVRAGEASGSLDSCFERLHTFFDKSAKNKGKVSGALTYPILVIVAAIVVFVIVMLKGVPLFKSTFEEMGTELPGITKFLIAISDFFTGYWWIVLGVVVAIYVAYKLYTGSENGRYAFARWRLLSAPLHNITHMGAAQQFVATFATMMSSGLNVLEALEVCAGVVDNYAFQKGVIHVREGVERGRRIVDCMRDEEVFPALMTEMTGVGEESGSLEETLTVVSDFYENEVDLATAKLLSVMEPAITVGLAVIVCVLLLAVYLPMFSMYGSM